MGCICSKGSTNSDVDIVSADADADAPHHSSRKDQSSAKPLRRLKEEPAVVPHVDSTPPPPPPPDSASDASSMKPQEGDVEKKAAAAAAAATKKKKKLESGRGGSSVQHQRRATVHTAAKTDDASSRGGRHGRDGSGNDLAVVGAPNGFSGEHVIAGWPRWLSSVAGEAIKGWLPRRADSFEKLDKIGQGTYSSVYRARDLETGKIVALKKVRFVNMDPESVRFMSREIRILRRLDHPNVIKLEGIVTSRMSGSLYLVFEYMDHDLAGLAARPGVKFTEPQIKCFMQQLLSGLDHCHSRRVLHRDIKGSNLLVDGNGVLRVGDFGLAAVFDPDKKQMLTSRVVTLWYRPPELLLGATEYDVAVDLWSTGCILAELLVGKPIMPGRTEVEQLHKIFKLCGSPPEDYWSRSKLSNATIFKPTHPYPRRVAEVFRDSPPSALALLDTLLAIEPEDRGTAASALQSDFFTTKPLACDPSSLPKFAPSKEYDTKIRDEETRRQREEAKGQGSEIGSRKKRDRKSKPEKETSTETQRQANPKSCSEKYNPQEDSGSGFPIDPPREHDHPRAAGSMMQPGAYAARDADNGTAPHGRCDSAVRASPRLRSQRSCMPQSRRTGDLSNFSGLAAATRSSTSSRCSRLDAAEPSEKSQELDRVAASHKKEDRSLGAKDPAMNYGSKNIRIHYSGPLVPPGGNIDDMLKEHERQIQQAVRKARLDKVKTKKDSEDH